MTRQDSDSSAGTLPPTLSIAATIAEAKRLLAANDAITAAVKAAYGIK